MKELMTSIPLVLRGLKSQYHCRKKNDQDTITLESHHQAENPIEQ